MDGVTPKNKQERTDMNSNTIYLGNVLETCSGFQFRNTGAKKWEARLPGSSLSLSLSLELQHCFAPLPSSGHSGNFDSKLQLAQVNLKLFKGQPQPTNLRLMEYFRDGSHSWCLKFWNSGYLVFNSLAEQDPSPYRKGTEFPWTIWKSLLHPELSKFSNVWFIFGTI